MDWLLSFTTLGASWFLGWSSNHKAMAWLLSALNSVFWIFYSIHIKQYGLIVSASINTLFSLWSVWKVQKNEG